VRDSLSDVKNARLKKSGNEIFLKPEIFLHRENKITSRDFKKSVLDV